MVSRAIKGNTRPIHFERSISQQPERHVEQKHLRTDKENKKRLIIGVSIGVTIATGVAIYLAKRTKKE